MSRLLIIFSPTALKHPVFIEDSAGASLVFHTTTENYKEDLNKACMKYKINEVWFNGSNNLIIPLAEEFKKEYPNIIVEVI